MSIFRSIKWLLGGEEPRIDLNDLKKLTPEELEEMVQKKRALLIKEFELNNKNGDIGKGLVGMRNLGNTCFMNAALQCLSNTSILTEYLLTTNWENSINSVSTIAEGRLVCEYFLLLRRVWMENNGSVSPGDVKKAIVRVSRTFAGYSQQDTQEFLSYFLDALHEDLDQVHIKAYIKKKDYTGEDIVDFANEAWKNHTERNKSFIIDNFHGQYFSKIKCPDCKHESITCDPFDMLSLNLPTREKLKFEGYFISYTYDKDTFAFNFVVDESTTLDKILHKIVKDWNKGLTNEETKLDIDNLVLYYYLRSKIIDRIKRPYDKISAKEIVLNNGIFFILEQYSPIYTPLVFRENSSDICQQLKDENSEKVLRIQVFLNGASVAVEKEVMVPENISSYQLYFLIYLIYRKSFLNVQCKNHELIQLLPEENEIEAELNSFFPSETIDIISSIFVLSVNSNKVLTLQRSESVFKDQTSAKIDISVNLNQSFFPTEPKLKSCKRLYIDNMTSTGKASTLYHCLDQFVTEEKLDKDNTWYCHKCKDHKEAFKKMAIMRYPKILIIHLKRFKKDIYKHHMVGFKKITELIDFPIDNLELNKYVVNGGKDKIRYALYGVANHYGNCGGGHYTANCKNRYNNQWYRYDDSDVSAIAENQIITDAAYVLFYELQKIIE